MTSFHFDCGNSNKGPIGFCARVKADSREEALEILKEALPELVNVDDGFSDGGQIEYINVYFNPDAVTLANSDPGMDEEDEDAGHAPEEVETGSQYVFQSSDREPGGSGRKERSGQTVTAVRPLTGDESEVEGMFLVRFADGVELDVFSDELRAT